MSAGAACAHHNTMSERNDVCAFIVLRVSYYVQRWPSGLIVLSAKESMSADFTVVVADSTTNIGAPAFDGTLVV